MKWISIADKLPPEHNEWSYLISGHEWFGIGCWQKGRGWVRAYIGEFPGDMGSEYSDVNMGWINDSVMWWAEIPDYPYTGISGCESKLMQDYLKGNK